MRELAPAKINPCLYLGPLRADRRHELVSVMQSISLCDELWISDGARDEVVCAGVEGPNLAAEAIARFREATGWDGPGQRISIDKRIPVAAGLGGGSADAAAALRLLVRRSGLDVPWQSLLEIAASLGADVPGALRPGRVLARGAGEQITALADPEPYGILVLASDKQLSTAAVYAQADRMGLPRASLDGVDTSVLLNELAPAAIALEPSIEDALGRVRRAGASTSLVSGSGPTVIGFFESLSRASAAVEQLGPRAHAARPVGHNWGP
ncbi:MAG: 4-(cytidine 5'-diphospho)-2-C-methyl-D-erythritol kinase [Solirubrobacteraceae bacterium]